MRIVSLSQARARFSELVAQVVSGEEVVITRRGKPIVRLCAIEEPKVRLASRAKFRAQLPRLDRPSAAALRSLRDEER